MTFESGPGPEGGGHVEQADDLPREISDMLTAYNLDRHAFERLIVEQPMNGVQMLLMHHCPEWEEQHAQTFREQYLPRRPEIEASLAGGDLRAIVTAYACIKADFNL